MALVRFTQEAPQQTGNPQHAGLRTQQSTDMYTRMYQQLNGIQEFNFELRQDLDSTRTIPLVASR